MPFRATSKRTRIETPENSRGARWRVRPFRATSKRTRIETKLDPFARQIWATPFRATSKRTRIETFTFPSTAAHAISLSEQHPREQGLKQKAEALANQTNYPFRATSKRTRIET